MENNLVKKNEEPNNYDNEDIEWKPFIRQLMVAACLWTLYFCIGLMFGAPTVMIPQLRLNANLTGPVSDDMASWLSSTFCYASVPWTIILPILGQKYGRKKTSIFIFFTTMSGFVFFYFSTTPIHILITELSFGVTLAAVSTVSIVTISEYTSPKYRGIFLCIKSATAFWGIWVANAIGTFVHWSFIPLTGFIISLFFFTVFYWPESPHWLATQKRFEECKKSHRWLKGTGKNAEQELAELIKSQMKTDFSLSDLKFISKREFYAPFLLCLLAMTQYHIVGKFVITIYAVEIIKKIIENEATVYRSMLILDAVTVFSTYIGCYLSKKFKRRSLLLISSSIAISFLLILSLYLYLVKISVFSENVYLSVFFLSGFSLSISCGPLILTTSLYGELLPTRFKSLSMMAIGTYFVLLHGILLKVSPLIFKVFMLHGTFLFFGLSSGFCLCFMYLYLPETKDKTLLEIEEYFKEKQSVDESEKLVA